ncbi:hypothetical protein TNCV_3289711 [Trichonephila clavipes]|nr:hypothetical protein TNCV_3289711 [Trichonephila clavipes]
MCGHSSLVVKVSDLGWRVMSLSPVPLKTRRVGERCTLNLLRAQTSSRWCGVVVRRGRSASSAAQAPMLMDFVVVVSCPCSEIKWRRRRPKWPLLCRRPSANRAVDGPWGLGLCWGV